MTNTLTNAGIPPPVPDTFDFEAQMTVPDTKNTVGVPLRIRNRENLETERFNEESIYLTIKCRDDRGNNADVGPKPKALWGYTNEEMEELVNSEAYCTSVGPLPICLRSFVERLRTAKRDAADTEKERIKMVEKEKTKGRVIEGSMVMSNPVIRVAGQRPPVVISEVFLHSMVNKLYPPLNWFTDERLRQAQHHLSDLHTKLYRPEATIDHSSPEKVIVFDTAKMISVWGNDESVASMTPLKWQQCHTKNFLTALRLLSEKVSEDQPNKITYAGEFDKHRNFFINVADFEETFADWCLLERELRHDILNGILFNGNHYASRVQGLLDAKKAVANYVASLPSPYKRAAESDGRPSSVKVPRTSNESPSGSVHSFPARASEHPPCCLVCGGAHKFHNHPSSSTTFRDGKPLFSSFRDRLLWTVKPANGGKEPKQICVPFNLPKGCDGKHEFDSRIHVCSLCGKEHAALSRDSTCGRVTDGNIRA